MCSFSRESIDGIVKIMVNGGVTLINSDKGKSMFDLEVKPASSNGRSPPTAHYALFAESLYDYMDKICLTAIKAHNNNTLDKTQKEDFLRKIGIGVNETNFIDDFNGVYKLPDRSVILMIKTIKLLEPDVLANWSRIKTLGKHCISEQCQELVYESALSFVKKESEESRESGESGKSGKSEESISYIPSVEINRTIKEKDAGRYDVFLKKCYDHMCIENNLRNIKAEELADTIIHGPFSSVASSTLLNIFKEFPKVLQKISNNEGKSVRLADFAARTRIANELIPLISVSTNPNRINLKGKVEEVSNDYAKIHLLMTFNSETSMSNDFMEYLKALTDQNVLASYSKIDKHLVRECLKKMRDDCPAIMRVLQLPNIAQAKKKILIKTVLIIMMKCQLAQHDGVIYDFEPILDVLLSPEMLEASDYQILPESLGLILTPTFSKITKSNLKKFLAILEKIYSEESLNKFSEYMIIFLNARIGVEDSFLESLDLIYEFYQENQLEIHQIIQTFLVLHGENLTVKLSEQFSIFCADRKLLSKTSGKLRLFL